MLMQDLWISAPWLSLTYGQRNRCADLYSQQRKLNTEDNQ